VNLLSNAIKFSEPYNEIEVKVSATKKEEKYWVNISVIDHGIGILDADLDRLFTPYFRTSDEKSRKMNTSSHGLGLNACYRIS